jgi:hypothetical protein
MKDYLTETFLIYVLRWIISAVVMFIPLLVFQKLNILNDNPYLRLLLLQIIGAFIFYKIDVFILSGGYEKW